MMRFGQRSFTGKYVRYNALLLPVNNKCRPNCLHLLFIDILLILSVGYIYRQGDP